MLERIFIHYLDKYVLDLFSFRNSHLITKELRFATRLAFLLCSDHIIIPASNYFETQIAKTIIDEYQDFVKFGYLEFASSSINLEEFFVEKQIQYSVDKNLYPLYFPDTSKNLNDIIPAKWVPRNRDATEDIAKFWLESIGNPKIWERFFKLGGHDNIEKFENELSEIPDRLEKSAFIPDFVIPLFNWGKMHPIQVKNSLNKLITKAYIESYLIEFDAVCMTDFSFFDTSFILPNNKNHISISKIKRVLYKDNYLEKILSKSHNELLEFKLSNEWSTIVNNLILPYIFPENIFYYNDFTKKKDVISCTTERKLNSLQTALSKGFDLIELKVLLFDMGIDKDEIAGNTKSEKIIEILNYFDRRSNLDKLKSYIIEKRPQLLDSG